MSAETRTLLLEALLVTPVGFVLGVVLFCWGLS